MAAVERRVVEAQAVRGAATAGRAGQQAGQQHVLEVVLVHQLLLLAGAVDLDLHVLDELARGEFGAELHQLPARTKRRVDVGGRRLARTAAAARAQRARLRQPQAEALQPHPVLTLKADEVLQVRVRIHARQHLACGRGRGDVIDGQANRRHVRIEQAVARLVGEAVGAEEVRVRRVREGAVQAERDGAVRCAAHQRGGERGAVDVGVVAEDVRGQLRVLVQREGVCVRERRVVDRVDGQADRRHVRIECAVVRLVGEAVGAEEVRVRRVRERAVRAERNGAVRCAAHQRRAERGAVDVGVVAEHVAGQRDVFVGGKAVRDGEGRVVDAGDGDLHRRSGGLAAEIHGGVAERVGGCLAGAQLLQLERAARVVGVAAVGGEHDGRTLRAGGATRDHRKHVEVVGVAVIRQHAGAGYHERGVLVRRAGVGVRGRRCVDELHLQCLEVAHVEVEALELEFPAVVAAREEVLEGRDVLLQRGELRLAVGELQNQGVGAGAADVFVVRTDVQEAGAEVAGHAVDQHIIVAAGEQLVAARTAVEEVVALAAGKLVVPGGADENVVTLGAFGLAFVLRHSRRSLATCNFFCNPSSGLCIPISDSGETSPCRNPRTRIALSFRV